MSSPLVLILGAGANIGQAVARRFNANGYKVALVNRTAAQADNQALFSFKADLTNPASVKTLFEQVKASVGIPSVVIYNGSFMTPFSFFIYIYLSNNCQF
jgi:NAD(P)-dependent dehydrogenase (short-subunit alcohol dehydrogenase family)